MRYGKGDNGDAAQIDTIARRFCWRGEIGIVQLAFNLAWLKSKGVLLRIQTTAARQFSAVKSHVKLRSNAEIGSDIDKFSSNLI